MTTEEKSSYASFNPEAIGLKEDENYFILNIYMNYIEGTQVETIKTYYN